MSTGWALTLFSGLVTIALKATGPMVLTRWPLPLRFAGMLDLMAPSLLAALVVTQAFSDGQRLTLDARLPGMVVALVSLRLRAPLLLTVFLAAATTAAVRLVLRVG